jgi:hypothetical protein
LVQYGVPARPGNGGVAGSVPVLSTMPHRARSTRGPSAVSTVTWPRPLILPRPRPKWPLASRIRSTATLSFYQWPRPGAGPRPVPSRRHCRSAGHAGDAPGLGQQVRSPPGPIPITTMSVSSALIVVSSCRLGPARRGPAGATRRPGMAARDCQPGDKALLVVDGVRDAGHGLVARWQRRCRGTLALTADTGQR